MDKEYIDRSYVEYLIDWYSGMRTWTKEDTFNALKNKIQDEPTADVAEVRHGKWLTRYIHNRLSSGAKVRWNVKSCSICTHTQLCVSDYCPRCGAKMNKE